MRFSYKRPFAHYIKKAHKPLQLAIEDAFVLVCSAPEAGELKTGDLAEIRVYKFRFNHQEYLLAYRIRDSDLSLEFLSIDFYQVGTHDDFFTELKHYLRQDKRNGEIQ